MFLLGLWQMLLEAIALGATYALVAAGIVVIFKATGLFNFAQGQFMALAGYIGYTLQHVLGLNYLLTLLIVTGVLFGVGALSYATLLRRLLGFPHWAPLMVTVGLGIVLDSMIDIAWQQNTYEIMGFASVAPVSLGLGAVLSNAAIVNIAIATIILTGLELILNGTRYGQRLQAAAENPLLAGLAGIRVPRYFALAWGIGGAAAAVAGLCYSTVALVTPSLVGLGLRAFPAALVGGIDSVRGAALGGFLVAFVEVWGVRIFGSAAGDATVFLVLLVTLTARPYGFFGSREIARV